MFFYALHSGDFLKFLFNIIDIDFKDRSLGGSQLYIFINEYNVILFNAYVTT